MKAILVYKEDGKYVQSLHPTYTNAFSALGHLKSLNKIAGKTSETYDIAELLTVRYVKDRVTSRDYVTLVTID